VRRARAAGPTLAIAAAIAGLAHDPSAPAAEPKRALALLVGLVGLALAWGRAASTRRARGRPGALAIAFVAASAASAIYGIPSGLLDLASWIAAVGLALGAASLGRPAAVSTLRLAALGLGGGASAIALAQAARGARGMALEGWQGNPNWLGLLIAVTLPVSLDAAWARLRDARRSPGDRAALAAALASGGAMVVQLPALLLSHSRVAWLATLVALPVLGIRRGTPRRRWLAAAGMAATVALIAVVLVRRARASEPAPRARASAARGQGTEAKVEAAEGDHDAPIGVALSGRLAIARPSAQAALTEAPLGAGLGRFGHAFLPAQGEALATLPPREASRRFLNATTAHDEYLQAAVESGPLVGLLLLAALVAAVRDHLRARFPAGAASTLALAVCALADSPLRQPAVVLMVGLLFASAGSGSAPPDARDARRRRALIGAALLATFALSPIATRTWLASRLRTRARIDAVELPEARLSLLTRAARLDPGSGETMLDLGLARLELGDAEGALPALTRSRALLANVGTSIAIGNAELALGRADRAEAAYREALGANPGSSRAHADLAEALLALGRFDDAEAHARTALSIAPGDGRVRDQIDRVRRARMDAEAEGPR
jgi:tetratricopeptide (TPR) repeat protein